MRHRAFLALACLVLMGCSTPKAVEEHHHHHYEADTMAVKAQVDRHLSSWSLQMDSLFRERIDSYTSQQQSSEQQHETVTELITVTTDSVGRVIRQEQRTVLRDITREQQQTEQRITRELERRMSMTIDSVNDVWSQRYDSLASHVQQMDSTLSAKTPVTGDSRPWYQRWWSAMKYAILGVIIFLVIWFTRSLWLPLIKR